MKRKISLFVSGYLFMIGSLLLSVAVNANTSNFTSYFNYIAQAEVNEGNEISDEGAWCWFADPRALHYENEGGTINSSYVGYIDVHGNIKATQHDFLTGVTNEVLIRSYFQPDDHNNPSFLILPDERVMIFYSRHTDEACFYYRISKHPGDITALGAEMKIETTSNTTYPSPFILSDDPDHFYLCWRGINWHPTIARLTLPDAQDEVSFNWGPYQMIQSTAARPYCKYESNGKDKIFLTYTLGHPDNEYPNFVFYNYVDVNSKQLKDVSGTVLSTIANGTLNINQSTFPSTYPNAVVDSPSNRRDWVWQTTKDTDGNPVIAMVQISNDKTSHDYYYAKWTGTEWRKTFLANGGGHFHQTPGLEMCYSGGMAIDDSQPNIVYCSVPVNGASGNVYEIIKYTIDENGAVTSSEQITVNSSLNNVRPYIVTNSGSSPLKLVWMHGNYYDWIVSSTRPQGYPTAIHSDYAVNNGAVDLNSGLVLKEEFDGTVTGTAYTKNGVLVTAEDSYATLAATGSASFSVSLTPYLYEAAYEGLILKMGDLEYSLNGSSLKPVLKIGTDVYNSTNLLGTSDVWQTKSRSTGGQWWTPTKLKYFNLTLTYENDVLKIFRNGLIDQVIEVAGLTLDDIVIGGFMGWTEDCRIYSRALLQEEVKELTKISLSYTLDSSMLTDIELEALTVPENIYTDVVLDKTTASGNGVTWVSDNPSILSNTGLVTFPQSGTQLSLTATINGQSKSFTTYVWPRDINNNQVIKYAFESSDTYVENNMTYVRDLSDNANDALLMGNAQVNGALDLTANTASGFSTNGYVIAPEGVLNEIRSFSFLATLTPSDLNKAPRIFDFGSASSNSIFLRANAFTAGYKYNGNSTTLINASSGLTIGQEAKVAMTFDARTKTTKVFLNGAQVASSTAIGYEPYQLTEVAADKRNYIGRTQWWDTWVAGDNVDFKGLIDEVMIYDIALSGDEITLLQSGPTYVNEVGAEGFNMFPNPVNRNSTISIDYQPALQLSTPIKIQIINLNGEVINSYSPSGFPYEINGIAVSGIYLVHLISGTKSLLKEKLVVM